MLVLNMITQVNALTPLFAQVRLQPNSIIAWQYDGAFRNWKGYFNRRAGYAHAANALVLFGSTVFLLAAAPYAGSPRPRRPTPPGPADGSGHR